MTKGILHRFGIPKKEIQQELERIIAPETPSAVPEAPGKKYTPKEESLYQRLKAARKALQRYRDMSDDEIAGQFTNTRQELMELVTGEIKELRKKIEFGRTGKT